MQYFPTGERNFAKHYPELRSGSLFSKSAPICEICGSEYAHV